MPPTDFDALNPGWPPGAHIENLLAIAWAALAAGRVPRGRTGPVKVLQPVETWKME
jgi:hypothetical protein